MFNVLVSFPALFLALFLIILLIVYVTVMIIINKVISAWSWKKINCSMIGDALSCNLNFDHVVILFVMKVQYTLFVELICHVRFELLVSY
jgi:hypothetical protein